MANYIPDPSSPHFDPMMLTTNVIGKAYRAAILYNKTIGKRGFAKTPFIATGYKSQPPNVLPANGSDSAYKGWRNPDDRDYPFIRYSRNVILPDQGDYIYEEPGRQSQKSNNQKIGPTVTEGGSRSTRERVNSGGGSGGSNQNEAKDTPGRMKGAKPTSDSEFGTYAKKGGGSDVYTYERARTRRQTFGFVRDRIIIVDLDYDPDEEQSQGRYYHQLELPFIPMNLQYQIESKWVGIPTMGRNNSHFHWTGSEDTVTFQIDWFSDQDNREDVILNCRWLESLAKADGYKTAPHRVKLIWGREDKLFEFDTWIVTDASYTLSQFQDAYREPVNGDIIRIGLLPQQAKQTITLKRVTEFNRRTEEIVGNLGLKR